MENKNICKLLKTARHHIILKYYGECVWCDTEAAKALLNEED